MFFRRVGRLVRDTVRALRGHDLALYAAGVTFYAGIALVPTVLVAIWMTGRLVGAERVADLGASLARALPDQVGAPQAVVAVVDAGLRLPVAVALAVLLPASFYGEGLRRAFVTLTDARDTLIGWRGRLLVLPLFVAAPVLVLAVLLVTLLALLALLLVCRFFLFAQRAQRGLCNGFAGRHNRCRGRTLQNLHNLGRRFSRHALPGARARLALRAGLRLLSGLSRPGVRTARA